MNIGSHDIYNRITLYPNEPLEAEILDCDPQWHVLVVEPSHENIAAAHLVSRRFGVYLPEYEKKFHASRGRPARTERRPLFTGYLFIYVWDIGSHLRRVLACPGVVRLLYDGGVPAVVPWSLMAHIQELECKSWPALVRKPRKRFRRAAQDEDYQDEVISIRSYGFRFGDDINKLDDTQRNSLLFRALGLT